MSRYAFPLCIQLALPKDPEDASFAETLALLKDLGFYGVELNVIDFDVWTPAVVKDLLSRYDLKMSHLATGACARAKGLCLGSPDEEIRKHSVEVVKNTFIPFSEEVGCNIICGLIKGTTAGDTAALQKSVNEIAEACPDAKTLVYLEITNHIEAHDATTLADGYAMIANTDGSVKKPWGILPDTYHMWIDENSMAAPFVAYKGLYRNLHVSDNNRYFPGFGAIDFYQIFAVLKALGYEGTMAIEGRNKGPLNEDIIYSAKYLEEVSRRIADLPY